MAKFKSFCFPKQKTLKKYLKATLGMESRDGFLYKKGTVPIMLIAHMDTVHKEQPKTIKDQDGKVSSPQGIGGDDRCGIYMVTEILKKHDCYVVFTEDEEIGGVGARKFAKSDICKNLKGKINYIIELDRKGSEDAVFYDCGNDDFIDFVTEKYFKEAWGTYSDIVDIAPALDCAAVNISCGYYKAHTKDEYVVIKEMNRNIREVCKLISRSDKERHFEWVESIFADESKYFGDFNYGYGYGYDGYSYGFGKGYGSKYGNGVKSEYSGYNIFWADEQGSLTHDCVFASSYEEAVGSFLIDHSRLTYLNIMEVYDEDFENEYTL